MAKILLGKPVAEKLNEDIKRRISILGEQGIVPMLAIIRCGENKADISYESSAERLAGELGIGIKKICFPETVSHEELLSVIDGINSDRKIHGCLMFRPLPPHLRECCDEITNRLIPDKDVDCMTELSNAAVYTGKQSGFAPCTAEACMQILDYYGVECEGRNAVVIGRSLVIGKPAALLLLNRNATVSICHSRSRETQKLIRRADIVITAAGKLNSLTGDYVRAGQTIIDVSINWDENKPNSKGGFGAISGDAKFGEVESIVEAITPVPGGVGAVTRSVLMDHVVHAAEKIVS